MHAHELVSLFESQDLSLHPTLVQMLNEDPSHRTERRGCGLTQATRFLSNFVNTPRSALDAADLRLFADWPISATSVLAQRLVDAGWSRGWHNIDQLPAPTLQSLQPATVLEALGTLRPKLESIANSAEHVESKVLLDIIHQVLSPRDSIAPCVPGMPTKPEIGSCSQAEEFFLEIAHGRVRRHGSVNLLVDANERAVMVEKMNLGESHSAIVIAPVRINEVELPPGSLCALRYEIDGAAGRQIERGRVLPLGIIEQARFLRLTTLSVAPKDRKRAFSAQVDLQVHGRMVSPLTTTLDDLRDYARRQLGVRAA